MGAQGKLRSHVGSFPKARPVLGEVAEILCTAGTEDVGAFPGRVIPRARAPLCAEGRLVISATSCDEGRLWVLSPDETYPGESA